jgi:hypothetical protein
MVTAQSEQKTGRILGTNIKGGAYRADIPAQRSHIPKRAAKDLSPFRGRKEKRTKN